MNKGIFFESDIENKKAVYLNTIIEAKKEQGEKIFAYRKRRLF